MLIARNSITRRTIDQRLSHYSINSATSIPSKYTFVPIMIGKTISIKLTKLILGSSDVETSSLSPDTISSAPQSLSTITVDIVDPELFDPLSLANLVPSLRKDGNSQIVIKLPKDTATSAIHTAIILAGLTAESERMEEDKRVITSNYKPPKASTIAKISNIKINIDLDDNDLIDEDDLLNDFTNEHELNAPTVMEARVRDYCEGWKPCDTCTCGRKEEMEAALRNSKMQVC